MLKPIWMRNSATVQSQPQRLYSEAKLRKKSSKRSTSKSNLSDCSSEEDRENLLVKQRLSRMNISESNQKPTQKSKLSVSSLLEPDSPTSRLSLSPVISRQNSTSRISVNSKSGDNSPNYMNEARGSKNQLKLEEVTRQIQARKERRLSREFYRLRHCKYLRKSKVGGFMKF